MSSDFNPTNPIDALVAAQTPSSEPSRVDSLSPAGITGYPSNPTPALADDDFTPPGNEDRDHGVLNYYFLLLAVLVVLILVIWFAILRRQRKKALQYRNSRQDALAQDVQSWGRRYRSSGPGRWRMPGMREPRPEEGLNDRGEAPPPYMPNEPEIAHTRPNGEAQRQSMELRDIRGEEMKPPEYRQGQFTGS